MKIRLRYVAAFLVLLLTEVCIAVFVHDRFIRPWVGDILVLPLLYCLVRIALPPFRTLPILLFLFGTAVEIAQYFDFVTLLGLQQHRILSIVLGSTFDPLDILCYFLGAGLVWLWQRKETGKQKTKSTSDSER